MWWFFAKRHKTVLELTCFKLTATYKVLGNWELKGVNSKMVLSHSSRGLGQRLPTQMRSRVAIMQNRLIKGQFFWKFSSKLSIYRGSRRAAEKTFESRGLADAGLRVRWQIREIVLLRAHKLRKIGSILLWTLLDLKGQNIGLYSRCQKCYHLHPFYPKKASLAQHKTHKS